MSLVIGPVATAKIDCAYKRTVSDPRIELSTSFLLRYSCDPMGAELPNGAAPRVAEICSSGMNAIMMALKTLLECTPGGWPKAAFAGRFTLAVGNELYTDTPGKVFPQLQREFPGLDIMPVDPGLPSLPSVLSAKASSLVGVFLESASNPSSVTPDWGKLTPVLAKHNIPLVVDNTWLSSASFNPFVHGAALVVESCTKYNSGGQRIAGVVLARTKKHASTLTGLVKTYGIHVSEEYCSVILAQMGTLHARVSGIGQSAYQIVKALQRHVTVLHPAALNCQEPSEARPKWYREWPGVLRVVVRLPGHPTLASIKQALSVACAQSFLRYSTSFGSDDTVVDMWPVVAFDGDDTSLTIRVSVAYPRCPRQQTQDILAMLLVLPTLL